MKNLFALLAASVLACVSLADNKYSIPITDQAVTPAFQAVSPASASSWSASWYYGIKSKATATVANVTFGHLTNLFGRKSWSLDVSAFAGTVLKTQAPIGGFSVGKSFALASQLSVTAGLSVAVAAGKPFDFGPTVGLAWAF